jgi:tetratricopeptide (TPR) repeat protein
MFEHYLHTSDDAARLLASRRSTAPLAAPRHEVIREPLQDRDAAWSWFDTELPGFAPLTAAALAQGFADHAALFPRTLTVLFERRGRFSEFIACQSHALAAAERAQNAQQQAHAHRALGRAFGALSAPRTAQSHLESAIALFQAVGDPEAEARSRLDLAAWAFELEGCFHEALSPAEVALALFKRIVHERGQAQALNNIGWYHSLLGDHHLALSYCTEALEIQGRLGDRAAAAATLDSLGRAHHRLGDYRQSAECYRLALDLYRDLGNRAEEAHTLVHLGENHQTAGDTAAAHDAWRQAAAIFEQIGSPAAAELREHIMLLSDSTQQPQPRL